MKPKTQCLTRKQGELSPTRERLIQTWRSQRDRGVALFNVPHSLPMKNSAKAVCKYLLNILNLEYIAGTHNRTVIQDRSYIDFMH